MIKDIFLILSVLIAGIIAVIIWYKKINSETTWIYFIYVLIINITFSLFVLIN